MGRSSVDFCFKDCAKPCGSDVSGGVAPDEDKQCVGALCHLYSFCDIRGKKLPWDEPVRTGPMVIAA